MARCSGSLSNTTERFAGDAAVYGNAEARWLLGDFAFMLPGEVGGFAYADVGRVYVAGASPGGWHSGGVGGLWFSIVDPGNTITTSIARGTERTAFYLGFGRGF